MRKKTQYIVVNEIYKTIYCGYPQKRAWKIITGSSGGMLSKVNAPHFMHVVLNNGAHESVGGQPSAGHLVDFTKIAEACGYTTVGKAVETEAELIDAVEKLKGCGKASFIDCRIHRGLSRKLPPIIFDHREAIDALMDSLNCHNR